MLLKDQAYSHIKERILNGELAPGAFFAERGLARELGMSKTPVRAAMSRLQAEGYVDIAPQQGIIVRELSFQEIVDHFDMRIALESFSLREVCGKIPSTSAAEFQLNLDQQEHAIAQQDICSFVRLDADFHEQFCAILGNEQIRRQVRHLCEKLFRVLVRVCEREPNRMSACLADHRTILSRSIGDDPGSAAEAVEQHLGCTKRYLVAA